MRPHAGLDGDYKDPQAEKIIDVLFTLLWRVGMAVVIFVLAYCGRWDWAWLWMGIFALGYLADASSELHRIRKGMS